MLNKQQRKLKRTSRLISVLAKYGFKDIVSRIGGQNDQKADFSEELNTQNTVYERIRMALEELGPSFVKVGQAFSNREDMLPKELITELQNLQDHVEVQDMDVDFILEEELNINTAEVFQSIDRKPIASASIAQVYKAILKDGTPVVLKVKRSGIQEVIEDDLLLMKDLAKILNTYFEFAQHLDLNKAIATFEKSLLTELSLVQEKENIQKFAFNFRNNKNTYVPKVYEEFSNNDVLCMEFIDGVKVTDLNGLRNYNLEPEIIADRGLQLFLAQILDYGFFHADPHAGNILVKPDGRVVFIDLGATGTILPSDKELLEDFIIHFISKRPRKLIEVIKKMAIDIDIKDERKLENDLHEILDFVHSTSLEKIDAGFILNKLRGILMENKVNMPEYFYLLVRGIGLIESVGRKINPNMDLVKSVEPYVKKIMMKRISPTYLFNKGVKRAEEIAEHIDAMPRELSSVLSKANEGNLLLNTEIKNLPKTNNIIQRGFADLILTLILCANMIATAIFWTGKAEPLVGQVSLLAILGSVISLFILIVLGLRMLRKNK
ncbi:ubiquinone biosynthesis protein [Elizabethkingia meningoseptica]|uniref:ABC1 kinase family protein n=1 Tax=Elizabethkingia meningoseptica TaxID=238 RepID=UPI000332C975|nr:AarF/UbiB family protein [Elizabethkingia meningoseptica]AQX06078.1 ubiquinone biosynthesis protein [Elizabethkingia meningoseptica]AQX48124.1 ubiquinone biosynthesis protein [Elizabethkingia meningoseptica]EOR30273.1 ubiquinone biosynthesis protein UbiB [Elizabethkingia meningoseptica ATCC 13253 = NBRC 12535]KUY23311.1 ubiquinone biosynthesis protein [Elizabethkingia meningoseptica]OPB71459.1 ubiquinone biosynthesis protein [Elizabethkingia meningoseptica]